MLMLLRRRCRAWLEIRRLDKELAQSSGLPLELPQIVPNAWNEVVWRLPVPNHPDAFMTASNAAQSDFIVYVNGLAFYRAWLALGVEDSQACPLKQDMPKDRKYPSSAAHFAVGIDSPVPLADVSPTMILGHFAVCFTDGMTRSMWLLAHEVAVFPVLSRDEASAVMLAEHVGVAGPLIDRHVSGDWGDVDDAQREANEEAVKECGTIVSVYHPHGVRVLIVTDGDRSHTVAMLPHEY